MKKDQLTRMLTEYAINAITSSAIEEALGINDASNIIRSFQQEWDNVECDEEGCSKEQDAQLDAILEDYADQLLDVKKN